MAALTLATLAVVLNVRHDSRIVEQYRRDSVLANLLEVEPSGDPTCQWDVEFSGRNTAGPRTEGEDVEDADFSTDIKKNASLDWPQYEAYAKVSGLSQRIGAFNGRIGLKDPLDKEMRAAAKELSAKIGQHTYSGSAAASPAEIEGLARAVDATGTYAGLAQGTYSEWASGENTLATASLSFANLRNLLIGPYQDATGHDPRFIVTTPAVIRKIAELYDSVGQIMWSTKIGMNRGEIDIGKYGFKALMFENVPFIPDRHCTTNTMYALDDDNVKWKQVPPTWSSLDPGILRAQIQEVTGQVMDERALIAMQERARTRLSAQVNAMAKTGDSSRLQLVLNAQLMVERRNKASKLTLT